ARAAFSPAIAARSLGSRMSLLRGLGSGVAARGAIEQSLQPVRRLQTGAGEIRAGARLVAWHPNGRAALFHHARQKAIALQPLLRGVPHFLHSRTAAAAAHAL